MGGQRGAELQHFPPPPEGIQEDSQPFPRAWQHFMLTSDHGRRGSGATAPQPSAPVECFPSSSGFTS